jgi:hypothetical protein
VHVMELHGAIPVKNCIMCILCRAAVCLKLLNGEN